METTSTPRPTIAGVNDERDVCECCGRTGLKRVVWLRYEDATDLVAYGVDCAYRAVYGRKDSAGATRLWKRLSIEHEAAQRKAAYRASVVAKIERAQAAWAPVNPDRTLRDETSWQVLRGARVLAANLGRDTDALPSVLLADYLADYLAMTAE